MTNLEKEPTMVEQLQSNQDKIKRKWIKMSSFDGPYIDKIHENQITKICQDSELLT